MLTSLCWTDISIPLGKSRLSTWTHGVAETTEEIGGFPPSLCYGDVELSGPLPADTAWGNISGRYSKHEDISATCTQNMRNVQRHVLRARGTVSNRYSKRGEPLATGTQNTKNLERQVLKTWGTFSDRVSEHELSAKHNEPLAKGTQNMGNFQRQVLGTRGTFSNMYLDYRNL
jgi:hypothetical protein